MNIVITSVKVIDPASVWNGKVCHLLFSDTRLEKIIPASESYEPEPGTKVISRKGMCISPGWCDLHVDFGEPGFEENETIESGMSAAAAGGFTSVVISPATQPVLDSKGLIEYIYKVGDSHPLNIFPSGAITKGLNGGELAEMFDMYQAGAIAFSEDKKDFPNAELLKLALQYVQDMECPLILFPQDGHLAAKGQMNESPVSATLGLKGIPVLSETIRLKRDIQLLEYAGGHIHFSGISSEEGVKIIADAKKRGLHITADVSVANLVANEDVLHDFDTRYKLNPPLRSEKDRLALIKAVKKGVIDCISADHNPRNIELKKCEFEHASFGMIGLENCYALLKTYTDLSDEEIVNALSIRPREILALPEVTIAEGAEAEYVLYAPSEEYVFEKKHIQSLSHNTPFLGKTLKSKTLGVMVNGVLLEM